MEPFAIPFDHDRQPHVGEILQDLLLDLVTLALNINQARWHAVGPRFPCLRQELESVVTEVWESADRLAERATTLGVLVDARPRAIGRAGVLKEFPFGLVADGVATDEIVHQMSDVVVRARAALESLGAIDRVSEHLVIEVLGNLERKLWKLQALRIGRPDHDSGRVSCGGSRFPPSVSSR